MSATVVLFQNVRVFDGKGSALSAPTNVLVRGNKIERVSTAAIRVDNGSNTTVLSGNGRTLMPGLIDAHWHMMMATIPFPEFGASDPGYLQIRATQTAREALLRGFTSVRDVAGPAFGIRRAIDEGLAEGPRIWAAGAMISQTSGHGDYRMLADLPSGGARVVTSAERYGYVAVADGVPEVLRAAREQLMQGANLLKLAGGGGVLSNFDPLDVSEYTEDELRAAVKAAEAWGTYVAVHAYTPTAIQTAIRAGVKSIEHGQLMDEPTAQLMAERGVWLSLQPFLDDQDAIPFPSRFEQPGKAIDSGEGNGHCLCSRQEVQAEDRVRHRYGVRC